MRAHEEIVNESKNKKIKERYLDIKSMRNAGATFKEIGEKWKITANRASQIYKKEECPELCICCGQYISAANARRIDNEL